MDLVFCKIENGDIFSKDFQTFSENNVIKFSKRDIAVVYAPNGVGKTSLLNVLGGAPGTSYFCTFGTENSSTKQFFHLIASDHNRENISGKEGDFFLGTGIRRELQLQEELGEKRSHLLDEVCETLKSYGILTQNNELLSLIKNERLKGFLSDCANRQSKGKKYPLDKLVAVFASIENKPTKDFDQEKLESFLNLLSKHSSLIADIHNLAKGRISPNSRVYETERFEVAIRVLEKYHQNQCVVCDSQIDWQQLHDNKVSIRKEIVENLDSRIKGILEKVKSTLSENDIFQIKKCLLDAVATGKMECLLALDCEFSFYESLFEPLISQRLLGIEKKLGLLDLNEEYTKIVTSQPELEEEDFQFIRNIVSNCMDKQLEVSRDVSNKRIRITLSKKDLLTMKKGEYPLSTGEQNFLSLSFELLRARNSPAPIVVIDDPISSFDSIYKNKIVFAILKMLEGKKRIVLTHSTDFIHLLDAQCKDCFRLYLLNNKEDANNGFIPVDQNEKRMLISSKELIEAFRDEIPRNVVSPEYFLMSMIPFMRGYSSLLPKEMNYYEALSGIMHGYSTEVVDIVEIYKKLFGVLPCNCPPQVKVSPQVICDTDIGPQHLVNPEKYSLLDRTLRHSYTYLRLRLLTEKTLVDKADIQVTEHMQLGQIIDKAFSTKNDVEQIGIRVELTSKKTLMNEFNHFEGNLSIFQPAIDISDRILRKETDEILNLLDRIKKKGK